MKSNTKKLWTLLIISLVLVIAGSCTGGMDSYRC